MNTEQQWFSVDAVAQHLAIGRSTVYRLVQAGEFPPPVKFGASSRWRKDDIEEYEQRQIQQRDTQH